MTFKITRFVSLASVVLACLVCSHSRAQQTVFLDFSGTSGTIVYTASDKAAILGHMSTNFAAFDVTFSLSAPTIGPFSTVKFNAGSSGGLAEHIDFGNTDKSDDAVVNITGLGVVGTSAINFATANIGSHELGHLLGLRHGDSYGPIGSGVHGPPGPGGYFPIYPGPATAVETTLHIMASPASVGSTVAGTTSPMWFGEREAIKLRMNEVGSFLLESPGLKGTLATAQALTLANMSVPNTVLVGANAGAGPAFSVDAVAVAGTLTTAAESDFYSFMGSAGDLMNIELMSTVESWRMGALSFDTKVSVVDAFGSLIPYYSGLAENDDEFETFDSILIDLFLPSDGMYFVHVDRSPFAPGAIGTYTMFMNRFNGPAAIPEPGSIGLLALGSFAVGLFYYRRKRNHK